MADVDLKVRIDPNIEGESALNSLVSKLEGYANKPYTIKVKVEAVEGQKGLNNLINGIEKAGRGAYKQFTSSVNDTKNSYGNLNRTMMKSEKLQQAIAHNSEKMQKSESESAKVAAQNYKQQGAYAKIWDNMYKTGAASNKQYKESIDYLAHRADLEKKEFEFREKSEKQIAEAQRKADIETAKAWDSRKAKIEKQESAWNKQFEKAGKPYEKELKEYDRLHARIGEDSKAQWAAQRQTMSEQERIVKELNSWTAARTGKTADAYKTLGEQADTMARLNSEVKNGRILVGDYEEQYRKASAAAKEAEVYIQREGKAHLSFGDKAKNAFSELSRYITPAMALREGIQAVKQMVQASMEIESAMTRIQIVTGATDTQMSQFFETASSQAQELGKGITDVAGSIETFSRLGYNLNEATNLSKFANIMANVGDVSVEEATTGITSIIKGFDMDASDAEHVSDVLIEVGQKYAISASELMQAFERGGASMYASGTSFEKSAALFAATNAALQNSAKTGTLWNTVSARIRSATSELQEMGESTEDLAGGFSKYRDELLARTGVDIQDAAGNYRDMYDIFVDIAAVWDKMADDQSQSRVAEILGGTRNRAGIMSTIQNIRDAIGAYKDAQDSAGTAAEANNLYMETTAAHVEQLKAAFQELSYDTFNGDLMKGVVDFGKGSLNVIDGLIDHVGTLGTTIAGVGISALIKGIKQYKSIASSLPEGTGALEGIFGFTNAGAVAIGAGAVTAAIAIYQQYKKVQEEQRQQALQAGDTYKSTVSSLDEYANKIVELKDKIADSNTSEGEAYEAKKELLSIQQQLTEEYGKSAQALDLLNDSEQQSLQNLLDMKRQAANDLLNTDVEGYKDAEKELAKTRVDDLGSFLNVNSKEGEAIEAIAKKYDGLISVTDEYYNGVETGLSRLTFGGTAEEEVETLEGFMEDLRSLKKDVEREGGDTSAIDSILGYSSEALNGANEVLNKYQDIVEAHKQAEFMADDTQYMNKSAVEWLDTYTNAIKNYNEALESGDTSAIAEASAIFKGLDATIGLLLNNTAMGEYSDFFTELSGQLKESLVAYNELENAIGGDTSTKQNDFLNKSANAVKELGLSTTQFADKYLELTNSDTPLSQLYSSGNKETRAILDLVSAAKLLGIEVTDTSGALTDQFLTALANGDVLTSDFADTVEEAAFSIETFSEYQSTLESALKASRSATGMTTEDINSLKEAYGDLPGFDANKLFETTMNGIHLNREEFERLNQQVQLNELGKLYDQLESDYEDLGTLTDSLTKKYGDLKTAEEKATKAELADWKAKQNAIGDTERLISQYEGLTSAYNQWQQSMSRGKESDMFETTGKGYESMKEILDAGWYGDEALNDYIDLMVAADKQTGDVIADFGQISQTIEGTSHSLKDYWTYEDGKLVTDGLYDFLDDVNSVMGSEYAWQNEDGTYGFNFDGIADGAEDGMTRLEAVAERFGTTTEFIQQMERALIRAGMEVNLGELQSLQEGGRFSELQQQGVITETVDFNYNTDTMTPDQIQAKMEEIDGLRAELEVALEGGEDVEGELDRVNTEYSRLQEAKITATVKQEIKGGKTYDDLLNMDDETFTATFDVETDGIEAAKAQIQELKAEAEAAQITVTIDESQFAKLTGAGEEEEKHAKVIFEKDTTDPDGYQPEDKTATVRYGKDTSLPDGWQPQPKSATATYKLNAPAPPSYPNMSRTITYTIRTIGSKPSLASGTMLSVAHADGSMVNGPWNWHAYAGGNIALPEDEMALVNELGTESVIRNGQWMLLPGGMHTEALKKGDIILSASQTKALLTSGKALGHGHAYALGTVIANAYASPGDFGSGLNAHRRPNSGTSSSSSGSSGGSKSSGSGNNNSNDNNSDEEPEIFDWIELAIDRIERAIKQLGITAKSTFKQLTTRLEASAEEIVTVTDEIELQQKAYERYIQQANSVGLSEELAERVRNGAIDINEYDKDTQELIDSYQEWYEKALDCDDAIQQLHEDLGQLYEDRFNDTKDDFDAQLSLLEHMTNTFENGMDDIEARGYLMTTKYYEAMRKVENQNIDILNKELDALIEKMSQAVNSGAVEEGSQAWYEMQQEINDVKEAIQEAETSVIEFGNSIREVLWDRFDYLQDRISQITDESDFLIDLLSNSKLHTDTGLFTNEGLATLGLHAQNYDVLMNQADRYAAEVEKLNKELANDPNNTKILEQKQEWIEAQRESILNAEEEKQAMISLVDEGMQHELDALNTLISRYKDSMDNAKNLYDYQKKVAEQSNKISGIQKQLRAYAGDDSEETRAVTQKLTVDLSDAMEKLEETQYARQISDQKAMLSDLYDTYELILNQRLDNVDALLADLIEMVNLNSGSTKESIAALQEANGGYVNVINGQISYVGGLNSTWFSTLNNTDTLGYAGVQSAVLNGANNISATDNAGYTNMQGTVSAGLNSLSTTNNLGYTSIKDTLTATSMGINAANATGYTSIKDTLSQAASNVGYKLSEEMESIWSSDGDADRVVSLYSDLVSSRIGTTNSKLDSINSVINGIAINIGNMVAASNKKAETTVKKTTPKTTTNTNAAPVAPAPKPAPKPAEAPKQTGRTDQEKYGVAIAIWNGLQGWGAGQDRKNKLEQKGFNYDEIQGIVNKIKGDIFSNSWSGKYYGITANDIPKYAYSKFKSGGIVDYTGIAQVDGTPGKPEAFLNAEDTKNFMVLKDTLRSIMNGKASLSGSASSLGLFSGLTGVTKLQGMHSSSIGDITYQINIPIDHVTDYDDFVNKMRSDTKFEKLIQSMTIGQLAGQSSITKNKYKW